MVFKIQPLSFSPSTLLALLDSKIREREGQALGILIHLESLSRMEKMQPQHRQPLASDIKPGAFTSLHRSCSQYAVFH